MHTPTCGLVVFPSQFNVPSPMSHDFSAWTQVKLRQIFTVFDFSFSGQKLNSKNAIRRLALCGQNVTINIYMTIVRQTINKTL